VLGVGPADIPYESLAALEGGRLAGGDYYGRVRVWDMARGGEQTAELETGFKSVRVLAPLPDGRHLAVGGNMNNRSSSGSIEVWDMGAAPPVCSRAIELGSGPSGAIALVTLYNGCLVAGCGDGVARIVDVDAGAVTGLLEGHTDLVGSLTTLPDGSLASGSDDKTVRLWDMHAHACLATLTGHTGMVASLAMLADGRLASGSWDKTVRLWDVGTRTCLSVLAGPTDSVKVLLALPDGRLVSGGNDRICLWDTRAAYTAVGGTVLAQHFSFYTTALALLPDGLFASCGSCDGTIRLWAVPPATPNTI